MRLLSTVTAFAAAASAVAVANKDEDKSVLARTFGSWFSNSYPSGGNGGYPSGGGNGGNSGYPAGGNSGYPSGGGNGGSGGYPSGGNGGYPSGPPSGGSYPGGGRPPSGGPPSGGSYPGGNYPGGGRPPAGGNYPGGGSPPGPPAGGNYPVNGSPPGPPAGSNYPGGGSPPSPPAGGSYPGGGRPPAGGPPSGGSYPGGSPPSNPPSGGSYPSGGSPSNPPSGGSYPGGGSPSNPAPSDSYPSNSSTGGNPSAGTYPQGSCRKCSASNPIGGIVDSLHNGVNIDLAIIALFGNKDLAKWIIEASLDVDFLLKVDSLCGKAEFLAKLDTLLTSDAFLNSCARAATAANINVQIGILFGNVKFMKQVTTYLSSSSFIGRFTAQFGADFNFGVKFAGWLGNKNFVKFLVAVFGQGSFGINLGLLLNNDIILTKIRALLILKADFAAAFGGLLADSSFVSHCCKTLGLSAQVTAKFTALFDLNVNFGLQLEAILGAAFKGKLSSFLGSGSCASILINFFGKGSFHNACSSYFGKGAFFKSFSGLFADAQFAAKFSAWIQAWFAARVDFYTVCGQIFADVGFTTKACGLLNITPGTAVKMSGVLGGGGFYKFCSGFTAGKLPSGGYATIAGGALGWIKNLLGGGRLV